MDGDTQQPSVGQLVVSSVESLEAAGVDSARLDAELLLAHAFGFDRTRLLAHMNQPVPTDVVSRFDKLLKRRLHREPLAYIRGYKEFMSLDFEVNRSVMIPRPATEMSVERALDFLSELGEDRLVMDVCTGSGCIGISIAVYARKSRVYASDICGDSLAVARRNAARTGVDDRITFVEGDLYEPFDGLGMAGTFDVVISNPPYVSETEWETLWPEAVEHEPRRALVAGETGLEIVSRVIEGAPQWLRPGGIVLVETGEAAADRAVRLAGDIEELEHVKEIRCLGGDVCGVEARRKAGIRA